MLGNKNLPKRFHLNGNTTRFRSLIWKLEWQTSRYLLSYFWIKYRLFSSNSDLFRLQLWGTWIYLFERPCKGQTFSQVEFFEQHSHKKEQRKSRKVSHWRSLQSLKYSITGQRKTGLKRLMCSCFLLQIFSISLPSSFNNRTCTHTLCYADPGQVQERHFVDSVFESTIFQWADLLATIFQQRKGRYVRNFLTSTKSQVMKSRKTS